MERRKSATATIFLVPVAFHFLDSLRHVPIAKKTGGSLSTPSGSIELVTAAYCEGSLLQGRISSHCRSAVQGVVNHTGLVRTKTTVTRLPDYIRNAGRRERGVDSVNRIRTNRREGITALGTQGQHGVKQASVGKGRNVRRSALRYRPAEVANGRRVAAVRERGRIRDFRSVHAAQRTDCRSFVGGHTRTQQVRDGDRRDDQNDRHDDQKLDK